MSRVIVHRRAAKYLQKLPKVHKERIKNILKKLEESPLELTGVIHMVGAFLLLVRMKLGVTT